MKWIRTFVVLTNKTKNIRLIKTGKTYLLVKSFTHTPAHLYVSTECIAMHRLEWKKINKIKTKTIINWHQFHFIECVDSNVHEHFQGLHYNGQCCVTFSAPLIQTYCFTYVRQFDRSFLCVCVIPSSFFNNKMTVNTFIRWFWLGFLLLDLLVWEKIYQKMKMIFFVTVDEQ